MRDSICRHAKQPEVPPDIPAVKVTWVRKARVFASLKRARFAR